MFFLSVRKSLPRFSRSTLRSHQIISRRSAVPAVHARPRRSLVGSREKERLLRIARKDRRGPLNSIVDPTQPGAGSALLEVTEAVKKSGQYDMWSAQAKAGLDDAVKVKVCCTTSLHQTEKSDGRAPPVLIPLMHVGTRRTQSAYGDRVACSTCSTSRDVV